MFKYFLQAGDEIGESHTDTFFKIMGVVAPLISMAVTVFIIWLIVKVVRIVIRHDKADRNKMLMLAVVVLVASSCRKADETATGGFTDKEKQLLTSIGVDPATVQPYHPTSPTSIKPFQSGSIAEAKEWYRGLSTSLVRDKKKRYADKEEVAEMPDDEVDNDTGVGAGAGSGGSTGGDNSSTTTGSGGGTTSGTADDTFQSVAEVSEVTSANGQGNLIKVNVVRMSKIVGTYSLSVSFKYTNNDKGEVDNVTDIKADYSGFTKGIEWKPLNEGVEVTPKGYIKCTLFGDEVYSIANDQITTFWVQPTTIIATYDPKTMGYNINKFKGKVTGLDTN